MDREDNDAGPNSSNAPTLKDQVKRLPIFKVSGIAKGLDLIIGKGGELRVCCYNIMLITKLIQQLQQHLRSSSFLLLVGLCWS